MSPAKDARSVAEYRKLHFASLDECMAEVRRVVAADGKGTLRALGNWTPGQIMAHLAAWIEYGYTGYPIGRPPFFVRWILRWRLPKMLRGNMPRGVRIPGVKDGTVGMDDQPTAEAGQRLLGALKRLQDREEARFDSPAFGPMSHDERILLNLRHAELHLGYVAY
jgi:hypothetical protein